MATDRRTFLGGLRDVTVGVTVGVTGGSGLALLAGRAFAHQPPPPGVPAYLATLRDADGFAVAGLDGAGRMMFRVALPKRGHGIAVTPDRRTAIVFARRPDRFAVVVDLVAGERTGEFETPGDRHFFGHGIVTPDGRHLFATENDFEAERGVVGVYDLADGYTRIDEFETGGIGPHQCVLLGDGKTMAVANGGILTHPDYSRRKLNIPTMRPSLAYVDLATGRVEETAGLPQALHQVSIRHLCEAGDGSVWWGGQYQGPEIDLVPLVGRHARGGRIEMVAMTDNLTRSLNNYVGSVTADTAGDRVAVTSPRGGRCVVFDAGTRAVIEVRTIADVCGVAHAPGGDSQGFVATTGFGTVGSPAGLERGTPSSIGDGIAWDNHLTAV